MTFWISSGHAVEQIFSFGGGGSKISFGDVWVIIWHHRRCLRRGLKIKKVDHFSKKQSASQKLRNHI